MSSRRSANAPDVEQLMREAIARDRIPGMSLAIATPEGTLFTGADGYADLARRRPMTSQDQYPWFSMTKIATATAAVRLHAGGLLDLDAPVGSCLPDYRPHPRHGHPTTGQLLSHTAGLPTRCQSAGSIPSTSHHIQASGTAPSHGMAHP